MKSALVQRVSSWFSDPNSYPLSKQDQRAWVYMATVDLLGEGVTSKDDVRTLHNFLTYLLRGWNPVTAWMDPHLTESGEARLWSSEFNALIKRCLDFTKPLSTSDTYNLRLTFSRYASTFKAVEGTSVKEEELSLTILMFWFLSRCKEPCLALDVVAVRACLDLYQRNRNCSIMSFDMEYSKNHPLNYALWLSKQLERLLIHDIGLEELCRELSYMAWFACLVRANRMAIAKHASQTAIGDSLHEMLEFHINEMYLFLNNSRLVSVDENDGRLNRIISVYGVRPKKKDA